MAGRRPLTGSLTAMDDDGGSDRGESEDEKADRRYDELDEIAIKQGK